MNKDIIQGKWEQIKGDVQQQWGRLTDDQLDRIQGSRVKLLGAIRESYGLAEAEAEKQLKEWERRTAA